MPVFRFKISAQKLQNMEKVCYPPYTPTFGPNVKWTVSEFMLN